MFTMLPRRASDENSRASRPDAVRDAFERLPEKQKEAVFCGRFRWPFYSKGSSRNGHHGPDGRGTYLEKAYARMRKSLSAVG